MGEEVNCQKADEKTNESAKTANKYDQLFSRSMDHTPGGRNLIGMEMLQDCLTVKMAR